MVFGKNQRTWLRRAAYGLLMLFAVGCMQGEEAETTQSESPSKPLSIFILSPLNEDSYLQGESIHFEADLNKSSLNGNQIVWTSNLDGEIGNAPTFSSTQLSAGMHTITVTVKDGRGTTPLIP